MSSITWAMSSMVSGTMKSSSSVILSGHGSLELVPYVSAFINSIKTPAVSHSPLEISMRRAGDLCVWGGRIYLSYSSREWVASAAADVSDTGVQVDVLHAFMMLASTKGWSPSRVLINSLDLLALEVCTTSAESFAAPRASMSRAICSVKRQAHLQEMQPVVVLPVQYVPPSQSTRGRDQPMPGGLVAVSLGIMVLTWPP